MVWYTEAIFIKIDKRLPLGEIRVSLKRKDERQRSKVNIRHLA